MAPGTPPAAQHAVYPPTLLAVAGALLVGLGVHAAVGMLLGFALGRFDIDWRVLAVVLGYGIWVGSRPVRGVTVLCTALLLAVLLVDLVYGRVASGAGAESGTDGILALVHALTVMAACCFLLVALLLPGQRGWFPWDDDRRRVSPALLWAVVVATVCPSLLVHTQRWQREQQFAAMYPFEVEILLRRDGVAEFMPELRWHADGLGINDPDALPPRMQIIHVGGGGAPRLECSGLATGPVDLVLTAAGCHPATVAIDRHTDERVYVDLEPIEGGPDP